MAQSEDTELRDLVIDALEKNGSLAKIRALLRANIFLAFEDESENVKHNMNLDNLLKLPEGILCLSLIHEFLEFCNLKNTLFVYMSESRQGKDYTYEGQKYLAEKLNVGRRDMKEPLLVTLVRNIVKQSQCKYFDQGDIGSIKKPNINADYKDDQNCTYIVHEDSSSVTSNSHSDNSSDEKNKLHLRLQLDNSDTDTSSDSTRDKTSSEYIPNKHLVPDGTSNTFNTQKSVTYSENQKQNEKHIDKNCDLSVNYYLRDLKTTNSSSDSTSYFELKSHKTLSDKLLKNSITRGVADGDNVMSPKITKPVFQAELKSNINTESVSPAFESVSSTISKNENDNIDITVPNVKIYTEHSSKSDIDDYSNDFTISIASKNRPSDISVPLEKSVQEDYESKSSNRNSSVESVHHNSQSSQSSVSISDVADLISEKSISFCQKRNNDNVANDRKSTIDNSKKMSIADSLKSPRDDSGDFSDSVPSLSNLSLDIHSD